MNDYNRQQYINENRTADEKIAFEEGIRNNPELRHQLNKVLVQQQQTSSMKVFRPRTKSIIRIGMSVLLIVSGLFLFFFFDKTEAERTSFNITTASSETESYRHTTKGGTNGFIETDNSAPGISHQKEQSVVPQQSVPSVHSSAPILFNPNQSAVLAYQNLAKLMYSASDQSQPFALEQQKRVTTSTNHFTAGMQAFIVEDWPSAIQFFQKVQPIKETNIFPIAQYCMAHAHFKMGHYSEAAKLFEANTRVQSMEGVEAAEWFQLLSWLPDHQQHFQEINALLSKILMEGERHAFAKAARYLQEDLQKIKKTDKDH